jgi:hypothetical protein
MLNEQQVCILKAAKDKVKIISRMAIYRQSVRLGAKPLEAQDQRFVIATELLRS